MDLKQFVIDHDKNNTLEYVTQGFQKSQYVESTNDIANLIKSVLNKLIVDSDKQKIYCQLQSGGLANNAAQHTNSVICKKQSFCTEFNTMVANILGAIGFEFSKYLFVIFGAEHFIRKLIESIPSDNSYEEVLHTIKHINNMMTLGGDHPAISIDDSFNIESYIGEPSSMSMSEIPAINYFACTVQTKVNKLFTWMIDEIQARIRSENIVAFEEDRKRWHDILTDMMNHLVLNEYVINSVDDLVINLGKYNICYDNSFIKYFEILYHEGFTDIPETHRANFKPHIVYVERELELDIKCSKYLNNFNRYFHKVYDDTFKSASDGLGADKILRVEITPDMYELMADITFNLYVTIARKIADNQITSAFFGKSTRIQFIQVFQAVMDCAPRLHMFTESQQSFIHYILLSDKILGDAVELVEHIKHEHDTPVEPQPEIQATTADIVGIENEVPSNVSSAIAAAALAIGHR